jgi:hypothetical protein
MASLKSFLAALLHVSVLAGANHLTFHDVQEDIIDGCFYQNHRYQGDTLPESPITKENYTECQKACQLNPRCEFFAHWASNQQCWLGGANAIYENSGAWGAICGPKWCATIPTGCTDVPDPAKFPGNTPDETEAMFSANRQPEKMECWPKNATKGWYDTCKQKTDLEDVANGWPAACTGLYQVTPTYGETCESMCTKEITCNVYVIVNDQAQGCWHGEGVDCFQRVGWPGATAGKRIMHGEVRVLANTTGYQIMGLHRAFDANYFVTQDPDAVQACRNACYSNVECEWWQYSRMSGCWTENPNLATGAEGSGMVEYPMTRNSWKSGTAYADTFIAGEYIQHVCPGTSHVPMKFSASLVPRNGEFMHPEQLANLTDQLLDKYPWVKGAAASSLSTGGMFNGFSSAPTSAASDFRVGAAAPTATQENTFSTWYWVIICLALLLCCGGLAVFAVLHNGSTKNTKRSINPQDASSDQESGYGSGKGERYNPQYAQPLNSYNQYNSALLRDPAGEVY